MNVLANPKEFAGKRVLISGGTKGLGRGAVDRFLAGGARVITSARSNPEPIDGVAFVQADLTTVEGGEAFATAAIERLGGVDILVQVMGGSTQRQCRSSDRKRVSAAGAFFRTKRARSR